MKSERMQPYKPHMGLQQRECSVCCAVDGQDIWNCDWSSDLQFCDSFSIQGHGMLFSFQITLTAPFGKMRSLLSFYSAPRTWKSAQWPAVQVRGVSIIKHLKLKACIVHKQERWTPLSLIFQARKVFCPSYALCCHTAAKPMKLLAVQKTEISFHFLHVWF